MELSIVIPAYNEAHKIARDVRAAADFLRENTLSGEIIVADDGSEDETAAAARAAFVSDESRDSFAGSALSPPPVLCGRVRVGAEPRASDRSSPPPPQPFPGVPGEGEEPESDSVEVRVLDLPHRGKGSAVRAGINASRGKYVMFADSGLCVPFEDALPAIRMLQRGDADIVNGSRKLPESVIARPQSWYRRMLSRLFRFAVRLYMGLPGGLTDTQCGFKIYRGDVARAIYGKCATDGFMFDLEVLLRAFAQQLRVAEVPVHWTCDRDSRLRPAKILFRTFGELRDVKRQLAAELAAAEAILSASPVAAAEKKN